MIPQYFKGDTTEKKFDLAGAKATDLTSQNLDLFFENGYNAVDFLLMLYDEGRMPFSNRVPRDSFVSFLVEYLANANFIGTYESYIFLVKRIFGEESSIFFGSIEAGVLSMLVSSSGTLNFDFVGREWNGSSFDVFEIVTDNGENISFVGFPGIDSEANLKQIFSEITPAGIYLDVTLSFFTISLFLAVDGGEFTIVDHIDNDIVFFEN